MKKINMFGALSLSLVGLFATLFFPLSSMASPTIFTIDQAHSQVTVAGAVNLPFIGNTPLSAEGPGSLTTSYTGAILANVTGSSIQFPGQSQIIALTNGVWQPGIGGTASSAPADYAGLLGPQFAGASEAALRHIELDLTSATLPLNGDSFDSSTLIFSFPAASTSTLDYLVEGFALSGSQSLTGYSTNSIVQGATLTQSGSTQTLTISIQTQFTFSLLSANDTTINLSGQIVAVYAPPIFNSLVVSNQDLVLSVQNASSHSQLLVSPDLITWTPATSTITTNGANIVYTVPITSGNAFFRVAQ